MDNHLIIGLGGTGGKIIRALRKTLYQEFRALEPPTAKLRFFYIDSSAEMMRLEDPTWRTLGRSVQLDKRSQLLITGSDLKQILDNLEAYPHISPWIGDRGQWRDILNSIIGETLGGQKRRLGRFLFACKAREFTKQLGELAREMQDGGQTATTFHICCGLAGGTGSGSVIDVISQIRKQYSNENTYRILVYTLLPDELPKPNWDTGNYHANGYASLLELNALSVDALRPHHVTGSGERLTLSAPFNGCYVFTNRNENGLQVDVEKELPTIVADFLFQKIAAAASTSWGPASRMGSAENYNESPETRPGSNIGERSKRFLTFGIKRLAIPEGEIREYLTYTFARQALLQLRFNHWSETLGFLDAPRNRDFGEFVKQPETQERWLISDDHVTLSRGILLEEINNKKWKPISQEWMDVTPEFISLVQNQPAKAQPDTLERLYTQRFEAQYRGLGVRRFYETKRAAHSEYAQEIRRRIESELFEEWKNGVKSISEVSRLLNALVAALEERSKNVDAKIVGAQENVKATEPKITANRATAANMGPITQPFKLPGLIRGQAGCLEASNIHRTWVEGWNFAKVLLPALVTEIRRLATDVQNFATLIDDGTKEFNTRIAQRCNDKQIDLRESVIRFYKPQRVKDFAKELDKDQAEQARQAQGVRLALIGQLGENPGFGAFCTRITKQGFFDVLEQRCEASARAAHDNFIVTNRERSPLFGVNIVGTLAREYSGRQEELRKFIHDLVERGGTYLDFDAAEVNRVGPGIAGGALTKVTNFMVVMPKAPEHGEFVENLKTLFRQQFGGGTPVEVVESEVQPNEITLIGVTNLFPLRYVKPVAFLKERYEERLRPTDKRERLKLELHCEGDGTQYPNLFVDTKMPLAHILLAKQLSLIQSVTNPTTGLTDLYLIEKDELGITKETKLGKTLPDLLQSLDVTVAYQLKDAVEAQLETPEYQHKEKRDKLADQIRAELNSVKAVLMNDIDHPLYKEFGEAARSALRRLQSR